MDYQDDQFPIGTRVRYSGYALESKRLYYLSLGDHVRKNAAKVAWESMAALRGDIVDRLDGKPFTSTPYVRVKWNNGTTSDLLIGQLALDKS